MSAAKCVRPLTGVVVIVFVLAAYLLLPASPTSGVANAAQPSRSTNQNASPSAAEPRGEPIGPFAVRDLPDAAPGYCQSSGGSSAYEYISNVSFTQQDSGTHQLSVQVYIANPNGCQAGEPCESYDPSPENVNVWIDYNGNKAWEAGEQVMDKALTGYLGINYGGTMSAIGQVVVPSNVVSTTWMRANLGWNSDPNDPCTLSWEWGNVVDKQVVLTPPKITDIEIKGRTDAKNPMTTFEVTAEAKLEMPAGYEVIKVTWAGDVKPGEGNPYTYIPDAGTHGQKKAKAILTYKHTASGATGTVEKEKEFKLFFKKAGDEDSDGTPNWFEHWNTDGAVTELNAADIKYSAALDAYGQWDPTTDDITLGSAAADVHYPGQLTVPVSGTICPGGTFGGVLGIDSAAEVINHERRHETLATNWRAGGPWVAGTTADSDDPTPNNKADFPYDLLPDDTERSETKTSPNLIDSCNLAVHKAPVYSNYGDNEFSAIQFSHGKLGVAAKDWANPGKQSDPPYAAPAVAAGVTEESRSGAAGPHAPYSATDFPAGVVIPGLAQLTGSYSDTGVDANFDALFETLRINVGINVQATAVYHITGWLRDSDGVDIAFATYTAALVPGSQQVPLNFDGALLSQHGKNGPYTLRRIEIQEEDHGEVIQFEENVHTTAAYDVTDFVPPAVTFTGAYGDSGQDTNANALFDLLNVTVGLQLNTPGDYSLIGWLYDQSGQPIPNGSASATFSASGVATLGFDGHAIRWQRAAGPYSIRDLEIRDANGEKVIALANAYTTAIAYTANQFEGSDTAIAAATYVDQGLDVSGDGKFDYLNVRLNIDVAQEGNYNLYATLRATERESIVDISLPLSLTAGGSQTVTLQFPGGPIRGKGIDGPYQVTEVTLLNEQGSVIDYQKLAHTTQAYQAEDFAVPLVALGNTIDDSPSDPNGDGSNDWLNVVISVQPGNSGYIIVQGRLVDKNGKEIDSTEQNVQVEGGEAVQVTLAFSATQIAANGVDGPFTLRDLLVYHTGDPSQAIEVKNAHTTAAYNHLTLAAPLSKLFVPMLARVE